MEVNGAVHQCTSHHHPLEGWQTPFLYGDVTAVALEAHNQAAVVDDAVLDACEVRVTQEVVNLVAVDGAVDQVSEREISVNEILAALCPRHQGAFGAAGTGAANEPCYLLWVQIMTFENVGNPLSVRH